MDYAAARHNMVENQIRTNRVTDPLVVQALESVPRELFVPAHLRDVAYVDEDIDLGNGRSLMEPVVFGRFLQEAGIKPTEVVLDIGCGTGYSAAVLARLASTVVAVESDAEMAKQAGRLLGELSADNVAVVSQKLAEGDPAHGPYDVIFIEGAVAHIPEALIGQLAEGGRLLAVVNGESGLGRATLVARINGVVSSRILFEAAVNLLPDFQRPASFVF